MSNETQTQGANGRPPVTAHEQAQGLALLSAIAALDYIFEAREQAVKASSALEMVQRALFFDELSEPAAKAALADIASDANLYNALRVQISGALDCLSDSIEQLDEAETAAQKSAQPEPEGGPLS